MCSATDVINETTSKSKLVFYSSFNGQINFVKMFRLKRHHLEHFTQNIYKPFII